VAIVTLLTDFGGADGYVGAMKGVIHRLAPGTTIVDLAHDVPRHDVAHAAWALTTSAWEFPDGTIHVVVVDPGVGGARAEVIVAADGHLFVGPDNGVFAHVAGEGSEAWAITSTAFRQPDAAATFHGRDVFAPTAAALARGLPAASAGPATCLTGRLPWPDPGVIVHVDVYGNLISDVRCAPDARGTVRLAGLTLPLVRTYEDVAPGEALAYVGSAGTIEIAVRERDAARVLGIARGEPLEVSVE
jgi:S-adenosylmethionine hydrolase